MNKKREFSYKDIDLKPSYHKHLFYIPKQKSKPLKDSVKLLLVLAQRVFTTLFYKAPKTKSIDIPKGQRIFIVNSLQQASFWEKTIIEANVHNAYFLINDDIVKKNQLEELITFFTSAQYNYLNLSFASFYNPKKISYISCLFSIFVKICVAKRKSTISKYNLFLFYSNTTRKIDTYQSLFSKLGPSQVFVLAYEVEPFAHIFTNIIHQIGGKLINSMNGLKAVDPRNSNTNFDAWLIWSNSQYKMLTIYNKTPARQLHIVGHLHADNIWEFRQTNQNNKGSHSKNHKRTIAIFSQPYPKGNDKNRLDFLSTVNHFLQDNPDYLGIIKPHPRESFEDFEKYLNFNLSNISYFDDSGTDKRRLYSLINKSDYILVMYSTVAVESLFFAKPVFSYVSKGEIDLLPISEDLVPRFSDVTGLKKLIEEYYLQHKRQSDKLIYEIGWLDGQNNKRAAKIINELL